MQFNGHNILKFCTFCLKWLVVIVCCIVVSLPSFAQGPGGDPGGDPDLIPIDGGLGFLLAAGVGYGIKKARDLRHKK